MPQPGSGKVALITGITGQDGAYLADLLLAKGYVVHGVRRRSSSSNTERIDPLDRSDPHGSGPRLILHNGDLADATSLMRCLDMAQPDEVYNLGAQSHVQVSFEQPDYTTDVNAVGPLRVLEAIRVLRLDRRTRFYQASTSEMFGKARDALQNETTPFYPRSPYAVSKVCAYWMTVNYREAYGLHASNGILFNHESPVRGDAFVTRKITRAAAAIAAGLQDCLYLGNLDARRDWGHARDYVRGMWLMLQQERPDDYVLATGETRSVRHFVEAAFAAAGQDLAWSGRGLDEIAIDAATGVVRVRVDPAYVRPAEVDWLRGDATKAREKLGWRPETSFDDLVREMVQADRDRLGLPR